MKLRIIILLGIATIAILFFVLRSVFFEQKLVSADKWNKTYNYESDDPYGASVFYKLIENKYGKDEILKHHKDTLIRDIDGSGFLYVLINQNRFMPTKKLNEINDFVGKGNSALIISAHHNFNLYKKDSTWINVVKKEVEDSIFKFKFEEFQDSLIYKNYYRSGTTASTYYGKTIELPEEGFESLASDSLSYSFFYKVQLDTGVIYRHNLPELFSNVASLQDFYLKHFNATFSYLNADRVIIDHPSYDLGFDDFNKDSYLEYILASDALKWAYYTFLFTTIGFIFFRGKRKQRPIPIPEKNENTSIQYVKTISNLFEFQNQNEKLVPHMESTFYHKVKQKYYLSPENEEFVELLSRKSKIPEKQITAIQYYFKSGKGQFELSDEQLIMLHRRLEEFYNNAE